MTINEAQKEIIRHFSGLSDWLDKYEYLIRLGKEHATPDKPIREDAYAIPGCLSKVWLKPRIKDGRICFEADSDSVIIKGMIALLLRVLNEQPAGEIARADLYFLRDIGLSKNLSPARQNSLTIIVRQIQQIAAECAENAG